MRDTSSSRDRTGEATAAKTATADRATEGAFAYELWAGRCIDELAWKSPERDLSPERKEELLALCPDDRKSDGRELLAMLPHFVRALKGPKPTDAE